jgi:cap1 methyltransferase
LIIITKKAKEIDHDLFCMKDIITQLNDSKDRISRIPKDVYYIARDKANPHELVGKSIFMNRSAIKIANLDHICNILPHDSESHFDFADICGGPGLIIITKGGFSEFLFWKYSKSSIHLKGWGLIFFISRYYTERNPRF